jgi:hypothetical protein
MPPTPSGETRREKKREEGVALYIQLKGAERFANVIRSDNRWLHLSVHPSICPPLHLPAILSVCSSVCPSVYLSLCLSVCRLCAWLRAGRQACLPVVHLSLGTGPNAFRRLVGRPTGLRAAGRRGPAGGVGALQQGTADGALWRGLGTQRLRPRRAARRAGRRPAVPCLCCLRIGFLLWGMRVHRRARRHSLLVGSFQ